MSYAPSVVLAINVIWFGLGFRFFALRPRQAVKLLVDERAREEASRRALVAALPFLGGMNFALAALSGVELALVLGRGAAAPWNLFLASGIAHASQFACNLPLALRGGKAGGAPWDVMRGPMKMIFAIDAAAAIANFVAAGAIAL